MKKKQSKKRKKGNDNLKLVYLFIAIVIALTGILFFIAGPEDHSERPLVATQRPGKVLEATLPQTAESQADEPTIISSLPKLAVIIDDIGFNKRFTDLLDIQVPLTLAIIPFTPYSREAATKGHTAGLEVMLHLPMEPKGYPASNPGQGALLTTMSENDILNQTIADLNDVPNIKGVNNHMGSSFTEYSKGMKIVLKEIKKRNLFFVDSKTSIHSTGYSLAKAMNIRTAERHVFLDNVQTEEAITQQLLEAVKVAKDKGEAVAIGHPYPSTVIVLRKLAPHLKEEGVELVLASALVK
ncbi:MAG: divergent polysaccharide deacetylase family protein [Proteobacteria bacterium]|nr:divergent polysaccharide deacetylase family protein [Pseudomonadota bacterium]